MSHSTSPSVMSRASTPSNQANAHELAPIRHRKSGSTGGGRAWSNEEETYLIEARQHKIPYKHIAQHLNKTELACRLHFHQISFGNKRRKRAASITSMGSIDEFPDQQARQQGHKIPQRHLPSFSPSPIRPHNRSQSVDDTSPTSPCNSHTPVLPLPRSTSSQDALPSNALRLITGNFHLPNKVPAIDTARLTRIYQAHRLHFWSRIATDYGSNASPAALEEAWRRLSASIASAFPPTPSQSPRSSWGEALSVLDSPVSASTVLSIGYSGFSPVNAGQGDASAAAAAAGIVERGSCAISLLLTDDKEVVGEVWMGRGG